MRAALVLPTYLICAGTVNVALDQDIERWARMFKLQNKGFRRFSRLVRIEEFRSLLRYRVPRVRFVLWLIGRGAPALYINTVDIGPGLFLQHAFATIIHAKSIGANCLINQQVTIGFSGGGKHPTIGNNVTIRCGAKVLGDIVIGDNVTIGAGAVVVRDVPSNCTAVGVPARILPKSGRAAPSN